MLTPLVAECCRIKAQVVMADERESGLRRILNFGHTVGHALEAITEYRRFRHGEAIGYGMLAAARLSVARGLMTDDDVSRLAALIRDMGPLPPVADLRTSDALDVIGRDKKVVAGRLHFVLARGIGATEIVSDVATKELTRAMVALGMRDKAVDTSCHRDGSHSGAGLWSWFTLGPAECRTVLDWHVH